MRKLILVKHAAPFVIPGTPPDRWRLSDKGKESCIPLADALKVHAPSVVLSSEEPKAQETAAGIAECWSAEILEDPRLREAERPWMGTGYRAVAHRYLRGEQPDGWEPHAEVAERMAAAVADAHARAGDGPAVVVSHGLALSVHLGDRLGGDFDRETFWSRLAFPDAWVLGEDGVLHRSLPSTPLS